MRRVVPLVLILVSTVAVPASADLATITVDVVKKTVDPPNPTVNIAANDAVIIRIIADGKHLPSTAAPEYSTSIAGPTPLVSVRQGVYSYSPDYPIVQGPSPLLVFRHCSEQTKSEYPIGASPAPSSPASAPTVESPRCPFYTLDESKSAWTIVVDEGILLVRVRAGWTEGGKPTGEEYAFALQVVDRKYALGWSAGFSFFNIRDEQYRLDPIDGDDQNVKLVRTVDGPIPYQLAAFAHYTRLARRTRSTSLSFGLATKVPVNELSAMLGATVSLRTLPLVNAGHLTLGLAYAPRKELLAEYRGRDTLPSGISASSLTSSRYDLGAFVAVTFSFFGGEEQFKGVYSGNSNAESN